MKGFTLIETMVAIAILAMAVAGPLYTADRAMVAAQTANSQLTASYLAQEGIEYVRMVRDNAYLNRYESHDGNASSDAWTIDFVPSITSLCSTSCQFDPAVPQLAACSGSSCTPLYLSPTNVYTQQSSGGTVTPYKRTIQATAISSTEEKIISTVSWNFHGTAYSEAITDHLTLWQ